MFLVVWKYAQMHANTFLNTPDVKKHLFWKKLLVVCKRVQKHKTLQTVKNIFIEKKLLVVWKYAQMHQSTFLSTPEGQKNHFRRNVSGGLEIFANALKHIFNHSRR